MAAVTTGAFVMRVIWAIIRKDLLIEWRAQARIVSLSAFAVLVLLLFSFAVGPHTESLRRHASGYLWLGVIFASTLLVQQSMRTEVESDAMTQLQLVPVSSTSLFYGKAIACFFQLLLISLVMLPPSITPSITAPYSIRAEAQVQAAMTACLLSAPFVSTQALCVQ